MSNQPKSTAALVIVPRPKALVPGASAKLSDEELQQLKDCETRVERGLTSFTDMALALMEINEKRLYRPKTWEEYLQDRWHMSRAHGNRYLEAAAIVQFVKMSPKGDILRLPQNERAYRMLIALTRELEQPEDARIKVLKTAAENSADAIDISSADILEAAVEVELAKKPVNKSKQRQRKWQGVKAQFVQILAEIDDERLARRLQAILTTVTGLMEPAHAADVPGTESPKGGIATPKQKSK